MANLTRKRQAWIDEYFQCWNATEAARRVGFAHPNTQGPRLLLDVSIQALISARLKEKQMSADEALIILAEQARADLGDFFKVVEEWTFYPLPTQEILGQKEVVDDSDEDDPKTRISYWVRHVVIDMDKLLDPRYSIKLKKFTDSPKNGLGIEIHDKQAAIDKILRVAGKYKDNLNVSVRSYDVKLTDDD